MEENLKELQNCKDLFLQVTLQILKTGNGLYTLDLMASAIANRAIALNPRFYNFSPRKQLSLRFTTYTYAIRQLSSILRYMSCERL